MNKKEKLNSMIDELGRLIGITISVNAETEEIEKVIENVRCLCNAYKEKYDKNYFLKRIVSEKMSLQELKENALKFHINPNEERVPYLLEMKNAIDDTVMELMRGIFPIGMGIHLVLVSDKHLLLLVPNTAQEYSEEVLYGFGYNMIETLNTEALSDGWMVCGPIIHHLSELVEAYPKLLLALKIRSVFYSNQSVILYNKLGVGRLVNELPKNVCDDFLNEVFKNGIPALEPEIIVLANCFFENNLNIAETARQLHMHRNTLIYRLEQIEKITGLNIKNFEDAVTFKIVLMIINNMKLK